MRERFHTSYRGFDVLAKRATPSWNDVTREAIRRRLEEVPVRRFLEHGEYAVLEAACGRIIPQPERKNPVPIAPWIDHHLYLGCKAGYRYEGMPPLREAWRMGLKGLEEEAKHLFGMGFATLSDSRKDEVLSCLQKGDTNADVWEHLSATRFFNSHLLTDCVSIYYAHPAAWSEIGFGGPASPRGYVRLGANRRDPWEAPLAPAAPNGDD